MSIKCLSGHPLQNGQGDDITIIGLRSMRVYIYIYIYVAGTFW